MLQYLIIAVLVIWSAIVVLRKYFQKQQTRPFQHYPFFVKSRVGQL